jgi:hypothetical protein
VDSHVRTRTSASGWLDAPVSYLVRVASDHLAFKGTWRTRAVLGSSAGNLEGPPTGSTPVPSTPALRLVTKEEEMVTVVKTITEHTNGRRQREDGTWERRAGVREIPNSVKPGAARRRPAMETVWEVCEGPRKVVYASEEHAESGIRGGDISFEIDGIEGGAYDLDEAEAEILFRYYLREFCKYTSAASGDRHMGWKDQPTPPVAWRHALRLARRTMVLFGLDLFETNVVDEPALVAQERS